MPLNKETKPNLNSLLPSVPIGHCYCQIYYVASNIRIELMYAKFAGLPSLLRSSSTLLQLYPAYLVRLTWTVCEMGGQWLYSYYLGRGASRVCSEQQAASLYSFHQDFFPHVSLMSTWFNGTTALPAGWMFSFAANQPFSGHLSQFSIQKQFHFKQFSLNVTTQFNCQNILFQVIHFGPTVLFPTIQFSIQNQFHFKQLSLNVSTQFNCQKNFISSYSVWSNSYTSNNCLAKVRSLVLFNPLTGATISGLSGPGSDDNEEVLSFSKAPALLEPHHPIV